MRPALKKIILCACFFVPAATEGTIISKPFRPWWEWDNATGDWFGTRSTLQDRGFNLFGTYYAEVWGNPVGGFKQIAVYDGVLEFGAAIDLEKLVGWNGATFQTTWLWLSGQDISAEAIGHFMTVSSIVGEPALRNYELWLEQKLFNDKIALRAGQLGADTEFSLSNTASFFLNSTFGWGPFLYMNLPNGGPGWPMGTLGVRLSVQPADWLLYRGGLFQGNVFSQNINRYGFYWRLNAEQGFFSMHELVFSWDKAILPGTLKAGGWFQTGRYANPLAKTTRSGNYGFYFILDQQIFSEPLASPPFSKNSKTLDKNIRSGDASLQGLSWFGRIAFGPPDRSYVDFYFDTGLVYTGLIPSRDEDQAGIAFAYGQISSGAQDTLRQEGVNPSIAEMLFEVTYSVQIAPWLVIQPDLQFLIMSNAATSTSNALVIGCRSIITF